MVAARGSHIYGSMTAPYPLSDHFDGKHFFNPGVPGSSRGLWPVLRWRLRGEGRALWPADLTNPPFPPPPEQVPDGRVAITFINHASFLIRLPGVTILTDPIFSKRCSPVSWAGPKRARPPGLALAGLPRPDIVLLSHNHYDHMDLPSLRAIQHAHTPRFVTTPGNAAPLRRLGIQAVELDWWQDVAIGSLRITATRRGTSRRVRRSTAIARCGRASWWMLQGRGSCSRVIPRRGRTGG